MSLIRIQYMVYLSEHGSWILVPSEVKTKYSHSKK